MRTGPSFGLVFFLRENGTQDAATFSLIHVVPHEGCAMSEKKEFRLSMRISDDEKAALIRAAAMRNMNISDYIRYCCFVPDENNVMTVEENENLARIVRELSAIGNNINQIARHINSRKESSDVLFIKHGIAKILTTIDEIYKRYAS